jgi:hypothetical protein
MLTYEYIKSEFLYKWFKNQNYVTVTGPLNCYWYYFVSGIDFHHPLVIFKSTHVCITETNKTIYRDQYLGRINLERSTSVLSELHLERVEDEGYANFLGLLLL